MKSFVLKSLAAVLAFSALAGCGGEPEKVAEAEKGPYLEAEAAAEKYHLPPKEVHWHHEGLTGGFDRAELQRGLQVYKQVCSACHSLRLVAFRDLEALGYSPKQVKAFAAEYTVEDGPDDFGDMFERPGKAADYFPSPFANVQAAASANNGKAPPDLSLMTKARHEGPSYIYSLLTGYEDTVPADVEQPDGGNYNPYFHSLFLAMAPPLFEGAVEYADGTEATVDQMAHDVAAFLTWTAEPKLEHRNEMGLMVMLFLGFLIVVTYLSYRKTWADLKK
ncbi:MAG: cytochrome c1 [Sphingomonadales bacterium]|jgi:cytochrome c1